MVNRIITKPQPGIQINWMHPLARELRGCWLFNEKAGSKLADVSTNNFTGTLTDMDPSTDWVGGINGSALDFDDTNDFVELGTDVIGDNDLVTMSVWVNFRTLGKVISFFGRGKDGSGNGWSILVHKNIDDILQFHVVRTVPSVAGVVATSNITVVTNRWYHVVGIWEPTIGVKIYVDGVLEATTTDTGSSLRTSTVGTRIGGNMQDTSDRFHDGQIEDCRIWNRVLSADEVKQLFHTPYAMFRRPDIFRFGSLDVVVDLNLYKYNDAFVNVSYVA